MKKGEIYKERGVHRKRGGDKSVKNKQKKHSEKRVNNATFCIIQVSSGKLVEENMFIDSIKLAFFFSIFILE